MRPAKDETVIGILRRLRMDLGEGSFVIEDHWEADLHAIGIARPDDRRFLVYLTAFGSEADSIAFECESPSNEEGRIYRTGGMTEGASYDTLLSAVRRHLLSS